jgi:DNA-binding IclR family transcriptional regulator
MSKRKIKAAETAFDIIETIQKLDGPGVSEIAETTGIAVSTAHTHLSTLSELEYLRKDQNSYYLSLRFLDHGVYAKSQHPLATATQPTVGQLAEDTGESAWVVAEEHGWGFNLEGAKGHRGVTTEERMGYRTYLHVHAPGKAILAYLPRKYVKSVIKTRGLPRLTENTIVQKEELFTELEKINDRGYAFDRGEGIKGLSAVAAPIVTDGTVRGAITLYGPSNRFSSPKASEEYSEAVLGAANTIELELKYN